MKQVVLTCMKAGQKGTVIGIKGGYGVTRRLEVLGIRPGKTLTKMSSNFLRGPVTVKIGNSSVAIGFGMASKILIEVEG